MNNKCIIVGNASNILNKGLGNTIDSFENVVRFNRFKIGEYKKDLGTKCTHWVVGHKLATDNMPVHHGYFEKNLKKIKLEHPELKQIIIITSTSTKKYEQDFNKINELKNSIRNFKEIDELKDFIDVELIYKEYEPFFRNKPTSGFMGIKYFLSEFKKISITGFDFGKSHHYWGNYSIADVPAPENRHPWSLEKNHVNDLVKQGKIKII